MACPYFLLSRYDFSCLRQRRLESDAEDRRRDCSCRRNHSSLPQRKLESNADTVETTNSVGKPCSDSQIDPLKSRIVARWSVFLGKPLESKAIKNAETLMDGYNGMKPSEANPSTTVHKLVSSLNEYVD